MICYIYKSPKKADTYLYMTKKDNFSDVPQPLIETFGRPTFVFTMNLSPEKTLAQADTTKVLHELETKGFYLQLPPPTENLLEQHLEQNK